MDKNTYFDSSLELPIVAQEFLSSQFYDSVYAVVAYALLGLVALVGAYYSFKYDEEYDVSSFFVVFTVLLMFSVGSVVIEIKKINKIIYSPRTYLYHHFEHPGQH